MKPLTREEILLNKMSGDSSSGGGSSGGSAPLYEFKFADNYDWIVGLPKLTEVKSMWAYRYTDGEYTFTPLIRIGADFETLQFGWGMDSNEYMWNAERERYEQEVEDI